MNEGAALGLEDGLGDGAKEGDAVGGRQLDEKLTPQSVTVQPDEVAKL